jgi:hypothetical protein
MRLRHLLFLSAWICVPDGPLAAQRPDFSPLRDSLAAITDVPLLYRIERAGDPAGTARTVEPIIRRGLVALRIWELTSNSRLPRAPRGSITDSTPSRSAIPQSRRSPAGSDSHCEHPSTDEPVADVVTCVRCEPACTR